MAITRTNAAGTWFADPDVQRGADGAPAWAKREWKKLRFEATWYAMRQAGGVDSFECVAGDAGGRLLGLLFER